MDWLRFLTFLCFLLIGLAVLLTTCRNVILARRSRDWPTTSGRIAGLGIRMGRHGESAPAVTYWYSVDGFPYRSSRVTFGTAWFYGDPHTNRRRIQELYPFGGTIRVRYDPCNPRRSVIEPRAGGVLVSLVVGSFFTAAALLGLAALALGW